VLSLEKTRPARNQHPFLRASIVSELELISKLLTVALLALATMFDVKSRRIPNRLTVTSAVGGLAVHTAFEGWTGAQWAVLGLLSGLGALMVPFLLGWVGAGDVKLLAAIGALQGPTLVLTAALYGAAAGGLFSVTVLLVSRFCQRKTEANVNPQKLTLPYGPPLALGTLLALLLH
jgi:Flp pilus assembly protein protease CpaA